MKTEPVNRAELLQALEAVAPAVSPKDVLEQSASFVFRGGWVCSFDNEVYVRTKCNAPKDLECAVQGKPLLEALKAMLDKEVELVPNGKRLVVSGARDDVEVAMDSEILLPTEKVERPGEWFPLEAGFPDGLKLAADCAGRDEASFLNTCVNVCPEHVESTDNFQVVRYSTKVPISERCLVRATAARVVAGVCPVEMAESDRWLHFAAGGGLKVSARLLPDEWHDVTPLTELPGSPIELPKSLIDAIKIATVFAAEYSDDVKVTVSLAKDRLTLVGLGVSGKHTRHEKVKYDGPAVAFSLPPTILAKMIEKYSEVDVVGQKIGNEVRPRLVVRNGPLFYLAVAETPSTNGNQDDGR